MSKASTNTTASSAGPQAALRWGVAGCGDLVHRRIAPALARGATPRLAAIWGRDAGRTHDFARTFGVELASDDIHRVCSVIDALYVATPVASHVPLALAALHAGCHVLVEKPLNVGLTSISELLGWADCAKPRIGIAYYRRLAPSLRWLRSTVRNGGLGRCERVEVVFSTSFSPAWDDPKAWRLERSVAGAGVLADAGSHRIDLLLWLFDRPTTIEATLGNITEGGCERAAVLTVRWANGLQAVCDIRWGDDERDRFAVDFTRGRAVLDPLDEGRIHVTDSRGKTCLDFRQASNPHRDLIADFEAAVAYGHEPVCPLVDAVDVDDIIVAAIRSTGKPVTIKYTIRNN